MPYNAITRDGFSCAFDRFYTDPGRVERVTGPSLRYAFLPKQTPAGAKFIRDGGEWFVRGQLKHYGVTFDESEFSGNGTLLLKKVLQAGKCDEVPHHITRLRAEMHAEWLAKLTPNEISGHPEWIMERYFLTSGQPDRAKTPTVVGIPLDIYSSHHAGQVREAASKVTGLHHETGRGPKTQTIFLGWNPAAVRQVAQGHAAKEMKATKAADEERDKKRAEQHADYLKTLKRKKGPRTYSPIGTYIIDCAEIKGQWPDQADNLSLDIRATDELGVFEASFDFGVHEGIMIMSTNKKSLEEYCCQLDTDDDEYDEDDEGEEGDEDEEVRVATGSKRKATVSAPQGRGRGRPPKQSKASGSRCQKFHLKLRCTETGEGQIFSEPEEGTIVFQGENMARFSGTASLPCVGEAVPFTGRKTQDEVYGHGNSWSDYSESVSERARVRRWH